MYTVKKTMRDAGAKHKGDEKFPKSRRLNGPIYVDDGLFRPIPFDIAFWD
jgi:hypothetical protein